MFAFLGISTNGLALAAIAAIPSCIAAWKGIRTNKAVDTGNGVKLGPMLYALDAKMDSLVARVTSLEEKSQ